MSGIYPNILRLHQFRASQTGSSVCTMLDTIGLDWSLSHCCTHWGLIVGNGFSMMVGKPEFVFVEGAVANLVKTLVLR